MQHMPYERMIVGEGPDDAPNKKTSREKPELEEGRTTLVIAHRLATVRNADRIVVMTPDGIAEIGRHEDLLAARGLYHALHEA